MNEDLVEALKAVAVRFRHEQMKALELAGFVESGAASDSGLLGALNKANKGGYLAQFVSGNTKTSK